MANLYRNKLYVEPTWEQSKMLRLSSKRKQERKMYGEKYGDLNCQVRIRSVLTINEWC